MKPIENLPKLKAPKPKRPHHSLDRLIDDLEGARTLYEGILARQRDFKDQMGRLPQAATKPGQAGTTPLRDFQGTDPLTEWYETTNAPGLQLSLLEKQGLIATIKVGNRFYSRPAQ